MQNLRYCVVRRFLFGVLSALSNSLTFAQITSVPGGSEANRPVIAETANGMVLVNIQTPDSSGVSHNVYSQFDLDARGAILNNSSHDIHSQLGGALSGNPFLQNGTAQVVLNEVRSSHPSFLYGPLEVAGARAHVVVANPSGITCDGCGFINAHRATLTTGMPIFSSGSLEGYRVQAGLIQVDGSGLHAEASDYTDLIARAVQVNAGMWAQRLAVTTGPNMLDSANMLIAPTHTSVSAPAYALDVSSLGGMYAQKIMLIGTEHGVGVRHAGKVGAPAGEAIVKVNGHLDLAGGTILARHLVIQAASLANHEGVIEQTGPQDLLIAASTVRNQQSGRIGTLPDVPDYVGPKIEGCVDMLPGELSVTETLDNQGGQIRAAGHIDLRAALVLNNDSGFIDVRRLTVDGAISNRGGELSVADRAQIQVSRFNNDSGVMRTAGTSVLHAQDLSNLGGTIAHSPSSHRRTSVGDLHDVCVDETCSRAGASMSSGATVGLSDSFLISAGTLSNEGGRIEHAGAGTFAIAADHVHGEPGVIVSNGIAVPISSRPADASATTPGGTFVPYNGGRPLDKNEEIIPPDAGFRYLVYSVTWQPSFCKLRPESAGCERPPAKFLTHGIWPYNDSTDLKTNRHPAFCNSAPGCTPGTVCELSDATLARVVDNPSFAELVPPNPHGMLKHEWKKHGTCAGKPVEDYFGDVVGLRHLVDYDRNTFDALVGTTTPFDDIRAAFPSSTSFRCFVMDGLQYLHEVFYLIEPSGMPYTGDSKLQIGTPCLPQDTRIPEGSLQAGGG